MLLIRFFQLFFQTMYLWIEILCSQIVSPVPSKPSVASVSSLSFIILASVVLHGRIETLYILNLHLLYKM